MSDTAPDPTAPAFPRLPGFLRIARIGGAPVDVHWSNLFGGLFLAAAGAFRREILLPSVIGYIVVVLVHEGGHAVAARLLGLKVHGIRLLGGGGYCMTSPAIGLRATLVLAAAGMAAQILLFGATLLVHRLWRGPEGPILGGFVVALTLGNAIVFAYSLFPATYRGGRPSDGRVLLQALVDRWHGRTVVGFGLPSLNAQADSPLFAAGTALLTMPALVPAGFVQGVEILNDDHTPMEFVMDMLRRHLGRSPNQAFIDMARIHNVGGLLIPLSSTEEAQRIAGAVALDTAAAGHAFVCRAVSALPDAAPSVTSA